MDADQILVMDQGRLVECGRHHELIAPGGLCAELHRTQFSSHVPSLDVRSIEG